MLLLPLSLVDVNRMSCSEQVYATSMAMLLTMVLSIYLFNFRPTLQVHTFYMLLISLQRYSLYITSTESSRIQINHVVVHLEWYTPAACSDLWSMNFTEGVSTWLCGSYFWESWSAVCPSKCILHLHNLLWTYLHNQQLTLLSPTECRRKVEALENVKATVTTPVTLLTKVHHL
jgi:hypothetical protein